MLGVSEEVTLAIYCQFVNWTWPTIPHTEWRVRQQYVDILTEWISFAITF